MTSEEAATSCDVRGRLQELAYAECIPLHVSLELTLKCNIRCTHCYNFDRDLPRPAHGPELSFGEITRLLDDLRRAGTLYVSLTGGEAMVHPRFWDILDEAAARCFVLNVLSNGTLLDEDACRRLAEYAGLSGVSLSVYGATPGTHDAVTQVGGSFARTWSGARRLSELGVGVGLKFILMKANAAEIDRMIGMADAGGFPYSVDTTITGRYDGTNGSLATRVDHDALAALYRGPLRHLVAPPQHDLTDDEFKCNCARGNGAVSSTGDVYPCIATPLRAGNIREQSFLEIWKNSEVFRRIRTLTLADFKTCAPCSLKAWCRHSPGPAVILGSGFTGVDPWVCKEAEILRDVQQPPA